MEIVIKNPKNVEQTEAYKRDPSSWNLDLKELRFEANVSDPRKSFRLVYWNNKVKDLFESEGYTWTINHLFCGTEDSCFAEIDRLGLRYDNQEKGNAKNL